MRVLNPVQEARTPKSTHTARPESLAGKVLGLYGNGKLNAVRLLSMIAEELRADADFTIKTGSYDAANLTPDAQWGDVEACDVVILANGDCGACSSSGIVNAIALERRGIPAFLISTPPFTQAVQTMARLNGMPDIQWAIVDHPLGSLDEEALRGRAKAAAAQFRAVMLSPESEASKRNAFAAAGA